MTQQFHSWVHIQKNKGTNLKTWASLVAQLVKNSPAMQIPVQSPGWKDAPGEGKATHISILVWRIPLTVQSMGSQRVRHD